MHRGFTLLEVVLAVGVFAIGMVAVIGLFGSVTKWESENGDLEVAGRIADALALHLKSKPTATVAALLKNSIPGGHQLLIEDSDPSGHSSRGDAKILFASRDGSKIGAYRDPVWFSVETGENSDREKFFEIALIRDEALSPIGSDSDLACPLLAYTARLRWPAFVADRGSEAVEVGASETAVVQHDHSGQRVTFFAGAVRR